MVSGIKVKRSKNKNFQTHNPAYPRDIWEFVAKSTERVYNTKTGALLKDVLEFQTLTPRRERKIDSENDFPKTIFPKIDPERLKPRAKSVDPDVERKMKEAQARHDFLSGGGGKHKKDSILGQLKGHFDVGAIEDARQDYLNKRPAWLQPKSKEVLIKEKKKEFDPSRGISKAEQEEMLTAAVFEDARRKSERARDLRKGFEHNLVLGKLTRVHSDLALNRVFFAPERHKLEDLDKHFASKMVDKNLDVRIIASASPTKFFEMVHRRLNPQHYHPESYEDIVQNLTPEPDDSMPTQDFAKSPYLTYVPPPVASPRKPEDAEAEKKKRDELRKTLGAEVTHRMRYHPRPGDDHRWGRRTIQDVFTMAERYPHVAAVPSGLGHSVQLNMTRSNRDSPWMGGGPGPRDMGSPSPTSPAKSPQASPVLRTQTSTFITQKSEML